MSKVIKLKNADEYVILDEEVYEYLDQHEYYGKTIKLLPNLRRHSSGCAVFQRTRKRQNGDGYETETIYLHKLIAESYLADLKQGSNTLVGSKNGNKLDCRKENLLWRSRSWASRQRKTTSKTGFMGVYKESRRYRVVISVNGKSEHIGMFDTAEEAAMAYNRRSWELFGHEGKQNKIPKKEK